MKKCLYCRRAVKPTQKSGMTNGLQAYHQACKDANHT